MAAQAGIWYHDSRPVPRDVVRLLSRTNSELGPDACRIYHADGIAMLSFSLQFDKLATEERQPVQLLDGSVLTWDGRLDNREDFLVRLKSDLMEDRSDARILALALQRWPEDALRVAIGDWSLVLWAASTRELMLARDYVGNRPLYYCSRPEFFVWSTAIEPIVELCGLADDINDNYMARWLTRSPTENQTLYRDVFAVRAGHSLLVRQKQQSTYRSFVSFSPRTINYRDERQYAEQYRDLFTAAVRVRLRASAPVWSELSGGYDSTSITCVAARLVRAGIVETTSLQPISVITPDSLQSDESHYISQVEEFCHLQTVLLPFQGHFGLHPQDRDAPANGNEFHETWEKAEQAGSHVLLSGEFGDDLTSGVSVERTLWDHLQRGRLQAFLADSVNYCRAARTWLPALWTSVSRSVVNHHGGVRTPSSLQGSLAAARRVSQHDVADVFGLRRDFVERALIPQSSLDYLFAEMPRDVHPLVDRLNRYVAFNYLSGASSCGALRVTYPFAHRPLLDFVLGTPPSILWRPEHPRAFICTALRDVLPDAVVKRRNKGYAAPAVSRYLIPAVKEIIADVGNCQLVTRGYSDPQILSSLLAAFVDGSQQTSLIAHRLLTAERLLRTLQVGTPAGALVRAGQL